MALIKKVELENGIVVNYHRIVSLNKITNVSNIIEIASYTDKEKRIEEIDDTTHTINIYINTDYINKDYNELETISDCYNFLKTTEKFKDAIDD